MRICYSLCTLASLLLVSGCDALVPAATEREQTSGPFDGVYVLDSAASFGEESGEDGGLDQLTQHLFSPLTVQGNVLRYGRGPVGVFELLKPSVTGKTIKSPALWHEDVDDPGDMSEVQITLKQTGSKLKLSIYEDGEEATTLTYKKKSS